MKKRVYEKAEEAATENLQRKLAALSWFVTAGIPWKLDQEGRPIRNPETGYRELDFYPKSEVQFSLWTTQATCDRGMRNTPHVEARILNRFGSFHTHGMDSLKKRATDKARARKLFEAVKKRAVTQLAEERSADKLSLLKSQAAHWKVAAESQAGFVVEALKEKSELERENQALRRALTEAARKMEEATEAAKLDSEKKDAKIAALIRELEATSRFKVA